MNYLIAAGVLLLLFFMKLIYDHRIYEKYLEKRRRASFGNLECARSLTQEMLEEISLFSKRNGEALGQLDDTTWNDLSMDLIFQKLNQTASSVGEEVLYDLLRHPCLESEELLRREEIITYLQEHEAERLKLQKIYEELGKLPNSSFYGELLRMENFHFQSSKKYLFFSFLFICAFAFLWVGELWQVPIVLRLVIFLGVMAHNILQYYKRKAQLEPYYRVLNYSIRLLYHSGRLEKAELPVLAQKQEQIRQLRKEFVQFQKNSAIVTHRTEGNPFEIILDYIRMVLFPDVIRFNSMMKQLIEHREAMTELFLCVGYADSMYAIASYRQAFKEAICQPEFLPAQRKCYQAKQLYHPLIADPVRNDFSTKRSVLFTGANASGKSTFLKTLGLNAILAQTIHTVHAEEYRAPLYWIFTSMALTDNLLNGESYYIVEIKMLKRLLDHAEGEIPVLCFIDEVLRGTNTAERIAASQQILASLAKKNALCMAATHDGELTMRLSSCYENYHFEETVIPAEQAEDGRMQVTFDYLCKPGPALTRNAILLLESFGYPEELTKKIRETLRQASQTEKSEKFMEKIEKM